LIIMQNKMIKILAEEQPAALLISAWDPQQGFVPILERIGHTYDEPPLDLEWVKSVQVRHEKHSACELLVLEALLDHCSYHLVMEMEPESSWLHITETLAANDQDKGIAVLGMQAMWQMVRWQKSGQLFSPHLVPEAKDLVGRHVMRSPALIAQDDGMAAILAVDIASIMKLQPVTPGMNMLLENQKPVFYTGLAGQRVRSHVYFTREEQPVTCKTLHHSYYIWVSAQAKPAEAWNQARNHLWMKTGTVYLANSRSRTSMSEYAELIYPPILQERWAESKLKNRSVGAIRLHRSYRDDVWFCPWFNSLRTSFGLYLWGEQLQRSDWKKKAIMTRDLVLQAPQDQGLYPTVFVFSDPPRWAHSHHQGGGPGIYHLFDMSWTAYQLLRWYRHCTPESEILTFCKKYSEGIMALQEPGGGMPSYVDAITFAPVQQVHHQSLLQDLAKHPGGDSYIPYMLEHHWPQDRFQVTAESGASLLFLAELCHLWPADDAYKITLLSAALKIAEYLERDIFPESKWLDFEVFFSCSPKPLAFYDHRSGQWPQNTLCLHLAAAGLLRLFECTKNQHHLDLALRALSHLCMYQQVWDPPFLNFNGFGGFGVMNTDGEWNDARQAQFADTLLDFYLVTGESELKERALAACQAGLVTLFDPVNHKVYPTGWWRKPIAQAAENHAHGGRDSLCGVSGFDWGSGSALATAAYFRKLGLI
jgi:hypothetical protein